jgi:biotin carboxyl carrier protein
MPAGIWSEGAHEVLRGRGRRTIELEVDPLPDGSFRVTGPGGTHRIDYLETTQNEASLIIDGRSKTFWFIESQGEVTIHDGRTGMVARAVDERTRLSDAIFGHKASGHGSGEVRSIMPGIVTRLLVKEGDPVKPGSPLLCIEAMKMENEVRAETSGLVTRLLVAPGATVAAGQPLVEIE